MISVCMATYNGGRFVEAQVASILQQLGPSDELVVSDDSSADDTVRLLEAFADRRVRVLPCDGIHRGYSKNFERALREAHGDVVFLADQDDVWLPERVGLSLDALDWVDFVVMDAVIVDEHLEVVAQSHANESGVRTGFLPNFLMTRYIGACMAFRRCVLNAALPFPRNDRLCAHDYWIACVAEAYFSTAFLPSPAILYRRHAGTATSLKRESSVGRELWRVLKRAYTATELARLWIRGTRRTQMSRREG